MKKIWRKNFEIQRVEYIMTSEAIKSFYRFQRHAVGRIFLRETLMVFENGDNTATYYPKEELRKYIRAILEEVKERPQKLIALNERAAEYNREFFQKLKQAEKIKFAGQTTARLLKVFYELYNLMHSAHGYSFPTTWFVDCDGEDLSKYLIELVKKKIGRQRLKISAPEAFSVLTSPDDASLAQMEEKEMFGILNLIIKDRKAVALLKPEDLVKVENGLNFLNKSLRVKILAHYKKWRWMPYTYIGPAYNLDYYLSRWSSLVRQKVEPRREMEKLAKIKRETTIKRGRLLKDLKLDKRETDIFDLAAQIVWLKSFRKDCLFYGMYIIDQILKELARRQGLAFMQIKYPKFESYISGLQPKVST